MSETAYTVIKYGGIIQKIEMVPLENHTIASERCWYIIKELSKLNISDCEKTCKSLIWSNQKNMNLEYCANIIRE